MPSILSLVGTKGLTRQAHPNLRHDETGRICKGRHRYYFAPSFQTAPRLFETNTQYAL